MPQYEAIIDGRQWKIELTRTSTNSFSARVDSECRGIKVHTDDTVAGKVLRLEINGKTYVVGMPEVERGKNVAVKVENVVFDVVVRTAGRAQAAMRLEPTLQAATKKVASSRRPTVEGSVTAPMTGKIVKVRVRKGDQVRAGQVLCVIEAMKMENEILAPRAGMVQEVAAVEGAPVNEGGTLFVIA